MDSCRKSLKTEIITTSITSYKQIRFVDVDIWGTARKYNRSSAPDCAWDVDKDRYYVCVVEDSTGTCLSGYWDTDYDYSIRKWKDFRSWEETYFDGAPQSDSLLRPFLNVHKYKIEAFSRYFIRVKGSTKWFRVNQPPKTRMARVKRRIQSGKIVSIQ